MRALFVTTLCCISAAFAQRGPAPYYEDTNNIPVSPEVDSRPAGDIPALRTESDRSGVDGISGHSGSHQKAHAASEGREGGVESDHGTARARLLHLRLCDRRRPAHARPFESKPRAAPLGSYQFVRHSRAESAPVEERRVPHGTVHVNSTIRRISTPNGWFTSTRPRGTNQQSEISRPVLAPWQRADRSVVDLDRPCQRDHG